MAVIQASAQADHIIDPNWPRRDFRHTLEPVLETLPKNAPIVIYVHGHLDWPHPDILQQARKQVGLAITLSWPAQARFLGLVPDVNQLYIDAGNAAPALAELINLLGRLAPHHQVDLLAHSLGARVGLQSLQYLQRDNLARFIGLAAVEFSAYTLLALQEPAARDIAFYNVTCPKPALFHHLMHYLGPRPGPADGLLCRGFAFPRSNWIDICLEKPTVQRSLTKLCSSLLNLKPGLAKPALISQVEAVFLQNRGQTRISELRNLLGTSIPSPLSLAPVRTPRPLANR